MLGLSGLIPPPPPTYGRRSKGHYSLLKKVILATIFLSYIFHIFYKEINVFVKTIEKIMEERQTVHKEVLKEWNQFGGTRGLGAR